MKRFENTPGSYGLLAGLLVLLLGMVANAGCMREVRGRDAGVAFESTVLITATCATPDGHFATFYGSGVIVNDHTVLTAAHVAVDPDGMICLRRAEMVSGKVYILAPGVSLPDRDLASLKLVLEKFDPTYSVTYGPRPGFGDNVCSMTAYPKFLWRCGQAQTNDDPPGDLYHTIVTEGGNSGSGVYDLTGRLVGIITHRWSCMNGQYCGGKMATLEGYVEKLLAE